MLPQELLYELSNLSMKSAGSTQAKQCTSVVPQGTEVSCTVKVDREEGEAYLLLQTNNESLIKVCILNLLFSMIAACCDPQMYVCCKECIRTVLQWLTEIILD